MKATISTRPSTRRSTRRGATAVVIAILGTVTTGCPNTDKDAGDCDKGEVLVRASLTPDVYAAFSFTEARLRLPGEGTITVEPPEVDSEDDYGTVNLNLETHEVCVDPQNDVATLVIDDNAGDQWTFSVSCADADDAANSGDGFYDDDFLIVAFTHDSTTNDYDADGVLDGGFYAWCDSQLPR